MDRWVRSASTFVIMYSITSRSTFDEVMGFVDDIRRVYNAEYKPILLVGNKADLDTKREVPCLCLPVFCDGDLRCALSILTHLSTQVTTREGEELAASIDAWAFLETSAKTRGNLEETFYECVRASRYATHKPSGAEIKRLATIRRDRSQSSAVSPLSWAKR